MKNTLVSNCVGIFDCEHKTAPLELQGYPSIRTPNIGKGRLLLDNVNYVSETTWKAWTKRAVPEEGDLIIAREAPAGNVAIIPANIELCLGQRTVLLKLNKEKVDPAFICYYLLSPKMQHELLSKSAGSTVPHVNVKDIKDLNLFNLPQLPTQKRIASILSAYDDLIENNLKRIKLLEEIAQRTYEEWFVKFRVNGEQLAIDEATGLPVGWEIIKVGDLLDKVQSTIKIPSSEILSEGIIPVIDQSRDFVAGYTNEKLSITSLSKPIIVFGDHTRVLKFIDFPFARGADGTQLILSKNNRMPQHLFYHSLLNIDLSNYHYARHFKYLKDSEIILPIEKYSNKYEGLTKPIFEKIKVLRFQNVALKQSRDILLPRLMSGTINVES